MPPEAVRMNLQHLKKEIEKIFGADKNKAHNYKQIASRLHLNEQQARETVIRLLKTLEKEDVIEELSPGKYIARFIYHFLEGKIQLTQRGSAYLLNEKDGEDVFIAFENLNTALNGDRVKVNILPHKENGKPVGEVIEILGRNKKEFVGIVERKGNHAFLVPDDRRNYAPIYISPKSLNKAQDGDKAVAKINSWKTGDKNPVGEIVSVLGKPGEHQTEMHAIIAEFGFAPSFPPVVEKEADAIPVKVDQQEIALRKDFRKVLTFTIDPEDAKDFDDAISIRPSGENWEIGVHIADVSHYVKPGSQLDKEALKRATSVYLVDRTVPMLPEKLSNQLCSLRPNEEKLTFSTIFIMDKKGKVLDKWIGKTIIKSNRRLTYEQAQEQIESGSGEFAKELSLLNSIAKILREERFRNGAMNFETEEVKFKLDASFKPVEIHKKIRKDAHKLIEEFMLLSNRTVATWARQLKDSSSKNGGAKNKTFVYRVHEAPNEDKLKLFSAFAQRFGYQVKTGSDKAIAQSFNKLLEQVEGKPEQNIIQSMAVRSMMKAYYSTKKTSHYGLGFDYYTHFTSPIRRYPDLMVHRLLFSYLHKGKSANETEYEEMCRQSSQMEIQAAEAERASIKYKQVEYIKEFIGSHFEGIISGVTEWGMFAEITEYKCEGLIRIAALGDDFYEFDPANQWIRGRRTGKKFELGMKVEVIVKNADLKKRQIDLDLTSNISIVRKPGKGHGGKSEARRNKKQDRTPKKGKTRRR